MAADVAVAGAELLAASAEVIAARSARMAQGLASPQGQDFQELALMGSEKVEAFSESAVSMASSADAIGREMGRMVRDEGDEALSAMQSLVAARSPAEVMKAQLGYLSNWWARAAGNAQTLNAELVKAQAKAVAPIHRTATDNARRLRRKP